MRKKYEENEARIAKMARNFLARRLSKLVGRGRKEKKGDWRGDQILLNLDLELKISSLCLDSIHSTNIKVGVEVSSYTFPSVVDLSV